MTTTTPNHLLTLCLLILGLLVLTQLPKVIATLGQLAQQPTQRVERVRVTL